MSDKPSELSERAYIALQFLKGHCEDWGGYKDAYVMEKELFDRLLDLRLGGPMSFIPTTVIKRGEPRQSQLEVMFATRELLRLGLIGIITVDEESGQREYVGLTAEGLKIVPGSQGIIYHHDKNPERVYLGLKTLEQAFR